MAAGTGKQRALALILAVAVLPTSGCSALWERSYETSITHVQQSTTAENSDILQADDYSALVNAILHFVSQGEETGTVRLYQYTGDVESDLESACQEIMLEDPLGSYALREIEHGYSRIVSYYECTFTFQYRRERAEIQSVSTVRSLVALRERIQQSMERFDSVVAFRLDFQVDESAVREIVRNYYYSNPSLAMGYPRLSINTYPPDGGDQQILEVRFYYPSVTTSLEEQRETVLAKGVALTEQLNGDRVGLWEVYQNLSTGLLWDEEGSGSLYDLLTGQVGTSESVALAMLLACQSLGIDCQMIEGTRDGRSCWWNEVTLDGVTYELDVTTREAEDTFLHTPEEMTINYQWPDGPVVETPTPEGSDEEAVMEPPESAEEDEETTE